MSKAQQVRDLSFEEQKAKLKQLRRELFGLQNEKKQTAKLEKTHRLQETRREISRILTIVSEQSKRTKEGEMS
ncbi:MAG: 50S ribosomal protein L29 [Waddliaceae bacterium]